MNLIYIIQVHLLMSLLGSSLSIFECTVNDKLPLFTSVILMLSLVKTHMFLFSADKDHDGRMSFTCRFPPASWTQAQDYFQTN